MIDIARLYSSQKTFVGWLGEEEHARENKSKPQRLKILKEVIGLPYDREYEFDLKEVWEKSGSFGKFLAENGSKVCCMRLVPKEGDLPWQRIRGLSVQDSIGWAREKGVSDTEYFAQYVFQPERQKWSVTFVVGPKKIVGNVIRGGHYQLTRGFEESGETVLFEYDFKKWKTSNGDNETLKIVKKIVKKVRVEAAIKRKKLTERLQAKFYRAYLAGYFEASISEEFGLAFGDYNRLLGGTLEKPTNGRVFVGRVGEDVYVCQNMNIDLLSEMLKAKVVVSEQGGVLSHAAIVLREFGIPALVGIRNATHLFEIGKRVKVDVGKGMVGII